MFWCIDKWGVCVGLRVCVCMCVLERISVELCLLRRRSVEGLSVCVCIMGSDC